MPQQAQPLSVPQTRLDIRAIVATYPELADDEDLLLDVLEGQTNLFELASALLLAMKGREAHAEGIKILIRDLEDRKAMLEGRAERLRGLLILLLEDAGLKRLPLDIATISIANRGPKPIWPDAPGDDWPAEFVRVRREINKSAINEALREGRPVPALEMDNGKSGLTVRMR